MNQIQTHTSFVSIYDCFLSNKVTDDMYMELTEVDTYAMLQDLLFSAICKFEFPRVNLDHYELGGAYDEVIYQGAESDNQKVKAIVYNNGFFYDTLSYEEINIIATYMAVEWLGIQLASVDNVHMIYAGSDFKLTSQANHMHKILQLKKNYEQEGFHLQRLYSRRIKKDGKYISTLGDIMKKKEAE